MNHHPCHINLLYWISNLDIVLTGPWKMWNFRREYIKYITLFTSLELFTIRRPTETNTRCNAIAQTGHDLHICMRLISICHTLMPNWWRIFSNNWMCFLQDDSVCYMFIISISRLHFASKCQCQGQDSKVTILSPPPTLRSLLSPSALFNTQPPVIYNWIKLITLQNRDLEETIVTRKQWMKFQAPVVSVEARSYKIIADKYSCNDSWHSTKSLRPGQRR